MTLLDNIISSFDIDGNDDSNRNMLIFGSNVLDNSYNVINRNIAFTLAYELALSGESPLFICSNDNDIHRIFPEYIRFSLDAYESDSHWNLEILSRIYIRYINGRRELKQIFSSLHAFKPCPSVVIIDDMSLYVEEGYGHHHPNTVSLSLYLYYHYYNHYNRTTYYQYYLSLMMD